MEWGFGGGGRTRRSPAPGAVPLRADQRNAARWPAQTPIHAGMSLGVSVLLGVTPLCEEALFLPDRVLFSPRMSQNAPRTVPSSSGAHHCLSLRQRQSG